MRKADRKTIEQVKLPVVKTKEEYQNTVNFLKAVAAYTGKEEPKCSDKNIQERLSLPKRMLERLLLNPTNKEEFIKSAKEFSKLNDLSTRFSQFLADLHNKLSAINEQRARFKARH